MFRQFGVYVCFCSVWRMSTKIVWKNALALCSAMDSHISSWNHIERIASGDLLPGNFIINCFIQKSFAFLSPHQNSLEMPILIDWSMVTFNEPTSNRIKNWKMKSELCWFNKNQLKLISKRLMPDFLTICLQFGWLFTIELNVQMKANSKQQGELKRTLLLFVQHIWTNWMRFIFISSSSSSFFVGSLHKAKAHAYTFRCGR